MTSHHAPDTHDNSPSPAPTIVWLRRDLRLADNPALHAACESGAPVIPVFILDPVLEGALGAAPAWRLSRSLGDLARRLEAEGSRLILRRGDAQEALTRLIEETGARRLVWNRLYDSASIARDSAVKPALGEADVQTQSFNASLLFEPWQVATKTGGFFKVFTPFWKAVRSREVAAALPAPSQIAAPAHWPTSEVLDDWGLERPMNRGAAVVARHAPIGEDAARRRLNAFIDDAAGRYAADRDRLDMPATSRLSEHLAVGEISPRTAWGAGQHALHRSEFEGGDPRGPERFLQELVWREFAYHLLYHTPHIATRNWREGWETFPWRSDSEDAERWRRGQTGVAVVDAAMREMYVTGTMHNRARMIVASFLTKHLLTDWRVGEAWFRDCLIDWDPASNAMGWQWVAGCGPDAAPYFRIFNPETQAARFDPDGAYVRRFVAELAQDKAHQDAISYYEAAPRSWNLRKSDPYPAPVVDLKEGRRRALAAFEARKLHAA